MATTLEEVVAVRREAERMLEAYRRAGDVGSGGRLRTAIDSLRVQYAALTTGRTLSAHTSLPVSEGHLLDAKALLRDLADHHPVADAPVEIVRRGRASRVWRMITTRPAG